MAEPFFFYVSSRKSLRYKWEVSGNDIGGSPENPQSITLDTKGLEASIFPLSVSADDRDEMVSPAYKSLNFQIE